MGQNFPKSLSEKRCQGVRVPGACVQFIEIFSEPQIGLENEAGEHLGGRGRV